ncbi:MAG: hypothetical protein EOO65_00095 [Methanosarcinales archaeon]|nr:MAG: hypothetical protein EOO65_00095 [Methanosarcinales archaeon]
MGTSAKPGEPSSSATLHNLKTKLHPLSQAESSVRQRVLASREARFQGGAAGEHTIQAPPAAIPDAKWPPTSPIRARSARLEPLNVEVSRTRSSRNRLHDWEMPELDAPSASPPHSVATVVSSPATLPPVAGSASQMSALMDTMSSMQAAGVSSTALILDRIMADTRRSASSVFAESIERAFPPLHAQNIMATYDTWRPASTGRALAVQDAQSSPVVAGHRLGGAERRELSTTPSPKPSAAAPAATVVPEPSVPDRIWNAYEHVPRDPEHAREGGSAEDHATTQLSIAPHALVAHLDNVLQDERPITATLSERENAAAADLALMHAKATRALYCTHLETTFAEAQRIAHVSSWSPLQRAVYDFVQQAAQSANEGRPEGLPVIGVTQQLLHAPRDAEVALQACNETSGQHGSPLCALAASASCMDIAREPAHEHGDGAALERCATFCSDRVVAPSQKEVPRGQRAVHFDAGVAQALDGTSTSEADNGGTLSCESRAPDLKTTQPGSTDEHSLEQGGSVSPATCSGITAEPDGLEDVSRVAAAYIMDKVTRSAVNTQSVPALSIYSSPGGAAYPLSVAASSLATMTGISSRAMLQMSFSGPSRPRAPPRSVLLMSKEYADVAAAVQMYPVLTRLTHLFYGTRFLRAARRRRAKRAARALRVGLSLDPLVMRVQLRAVAVLQNFCRCVPAMAARLQLRELARFRERRDVKFFLQQEMEFNALIAPQREGTLYSYAQTAAM